jgi:hypothetical protein
LAKLRVALSRWASAQVCEVMHARTARVRQEALSIGREVPAERPALAQLFRERPPAIRGLAEQIN